MSEQTETKQVNATNATDAKLQAFAAAIIERAENRIVRAKETAYKPLSFEFSPLDLGMDNTAVDRVKVFYTREKINQVVSSLLGCSAKEYDRIVLGKIEEAQAWGEYNQTVRAMLKENKHLLLGK